MTIVGFVLIICLQGCDNVMLYDNAAQCRQASEVARQQLPKASFACVPVYTSAEQEEGK